jgi:hypothetical protein
MIWYLPPDLDPDIMGCTSSKVTPRVIALTKQDLSRCTKAIEDSVKYLWDEGLPAPLRTMMALPPAVSDLEYALGTARVYLRHHPDAANVVDLFVQNLETAIRQLRRDYAV